MKKTITILVVYLFLINCNVQTEYQLPNNSVVACIGDSITYGGKDGYPEALQKYIDDQYPDKNIRFLNWGKNSETITNLTELHHPGPRPFLFDRLDDLLVQSPKPDVVTFCYGMNCGIYGKPSVSVFKKYKEGLIRFLNTMKNQNIEVVLLTPPPFALEAANAHGRKSAQGDSYGWMYPYEKYDVEVIQQFRNIILQVKHPAIVAKVDIYTPLIKEADACYGTDPIHPNQYGEELIARVVKEKLIE